MSEEAQLLDALRPELESMAEEMVVRTREEIPSFAAVPYEEHLRDTVTSVELLLADDPGPGAAGRLSEIGSRRAAQGVPVEDLLRAWRLSVTLGTDRARAVAERRGVSPQLVIGVFQEALGAADEAMVSVAEGHRLAAAEAPRRDRTEELVHAALGGSLAVDALRAGVGERGLDLTCRYRAIRARGEPEALAATRDRLSGSESEVRGLFASERVELVGFSAVDPERGGAGLIAVGPAVGLESLPASDRIARRVSAAARRFALAGVHDLSSAALYVAVLESGDVGEALRDRYVEPVRASASGEELLVSVRAWLTAGMRVDPAAERLHVHENTLRYRLRRYEELAGADLSVTEELIGAWWALHLDAAAAPAAAPGPTAG